MSKSKDLSAIIHEAKKGDKKAFTELYEATEKQANQTVTNVVYQHQLEQLVRPHDKEDILQNAYMQMFHDLKNFNESMEFAPWMKKIVARRVFDWLKTKGPKKENRIMLWENLDEHFDLAKDELEFLPAEYFERESKREEIGKIIASLPAPQAMTINLFYMVQMKIDEIAELMECSPNTIKGRLLQGREKIKQAVLEKEKEGFKLYGSTVAAAPFFAEYFKADLQSGAYDLPAAASKRILAGALKGAAAQGAITSGGIGHSIAAMSTAAKVGIVAATATVVAAGVGVPVYIHHEQAIIQQQEAEQLAAAQQAIEEQEQYEAELQAELERFVAEQKAAEEAAEAERIAAEEQAASEAAEAQRIAEEERTASEAASEQLQASQPLAPYAPEASQAPANAQGGASQIPDGPAGAAGLPGEGDPGTTNSGGGTSTGYEGQSEPPSGAGKNAANKMSDQGYDVSWDQNLGGWTYQTGSGTTVLIYPDGGSKLLDS